MTRSEYAALTPREQLLQLLLLAADKGVLRRLVLSKSADATRVRATLTPKHMGGRAVLQLETFYTDNKARHQNIAPDDAPSLRAALEGYGQINLLTTLPGVDCELKCAASGKQTLLRGGALLDRLTGLAAAEVPTAVENNRKKQYILQGNEPFLRLLGVSDPNGRVYDKKQSKFRQINRFLELLRDVEDELPSDGELCVCDLCCGKSYLSFAVYHYLTVIKGRTVDMHCVDLKEDVIRSCAEAARTLGFDGLHFVCGDVAAFELPGRHVHLVVSLHACDTATDLVLGKAMDWHSEVILSTPCCHHELNHTLDCPELVSIAEHSMLRQKLCDAATDAMRLLLLQSRGYAVSALELIDPEETPKNVMLRAVRRKKVSEQALALARERYESAVRFFIRTEGAAQDAFLKR